MSVERPASLEVLRTSAVLAADVKASAVKSADRALQILEVLSSHVSGLTFAEICAALDLPKSSAHALLATMITRRFLEQDPVSQRYRVGLRVWELAQHVGGRLTDLAEMAVPYLTRVRDDLNEVVQLAVLDGTDNVYIARKDANQSLTLVSQVGVRLPAHATGLGKALLAGLADDEIRRRYAGYRFVAFTPRTVTTIDELEADLVDVRSRGYAVDQGEYTDGVACTAMPVRDNDGETVAALSVSVPIVRLTPALGQRIHEALRDAVTDLSSRLGCPPADPSSWYPSPKTLAADVAVSGGA